MHLHLVRKFDTVLTLACRQTREHFSEKKFLMMKNAIKRMLPVALVMLSTALAPAPAFAQVRVQIGVPYVRFSAEAPPPMREEVIIARPSREHVWIRGYWDRDGDRWAWREGRWERPEHRNNRYGRGNGKGSKFHKD